MCHICDELYEKALSGRSRSFDDELMRAQQQAREASDRRHDRAIELSIVLARIEVTGSQLEADRKVIELKIAREQAKLDRRRSDDEQLSHTQRARIHRAIASYQLAIKDIELRQASLVDRVEAIGIELVDMKREDAEASNPLSELFSMLGVDNLFGGPGKTSFSSLQDDPRFFTERDLPKVFGVDLDALRRFATGGDSPGPFGNGLH